MMKYLVIGDPVGHSRSPGMQNAAFRHHGLGEPYGIRRVTPEELAAFVEEARGAFRGVNLTIPHKEAVLPLVDEVDPAARLAGSVNTLVIENGRIKGYSTDGYGLEMALEYNFKRPVAGAEFLFLGAGGAARATLFHLAERGAAALRIANRSPEKAEQLAAELRRSFPGVPVETGGLADRERLANWLRRSDFLIQATSLGLKDEDAPPIPLELLRPDLKLALFDTIYRETPLLLKARELGLPAAGGKEMLIRQGARSFELWTGREAPLEAMRNGFDKQ